MSSPEKSQTRHPALIWLAKNWIVVAVILGLVFIGLGIATWDWTRKPHITNNQTAGTVAVLDVPQLNVSMTSPQVSTYQIETVSVSSWIVNGTGNGSSSRPSPGPISIQLIDAGGHTIPGYGCERCPLTHGVSATSIYLDPTFDSSATVGSCPVPYVGQVQVVVHDFATNATMYGSFFIFMSPTYSARLDQCQRDAGNATIQARTNAILGGASSLLLVQDAVLFGFAAFMWGLSSHRKARRDETWSWWDSVRWWARVRTRSPENPMNLVLDENSSWSKTIPMELRQMNETQRIRIIRRELLQHGKLLDELARAVKTRADYVRKIRDIRTPQGLDEETFLQKYAPVPDDFTGANAPKKEGKT